LVEGSGGIKRVSSSIRQYGCRRCLK